MAGNPKRRAILEAAGLWPAPEGMTKKQALPLALEKLGYAAGTRLTEVKLAPSQSEAGANSE